MLKLFSRGFWEAVARLILRNRFLIILTLLVATILLARQWENMRFTYTEANLLPDKHPVNLDYATFLDTFGEEGTLIVLGVRDTALFEPSRFNAWHRLGVSFREFPEVASTISVGDMQRLVKNQNEQRFELKPFISDSIVRDGAL